MTPEQFKAYISERREVVKNRVWNMEQYATTAEADEAIDRQLRKIYFDGRQDGITASPLKKKFYTIKPDAI
jgi:UV DNA damage repair endonuclease